jgi:nitroreductase
MTASRPAQQAADISAGAAAGDALGYLAQRFSVGPKHLQAPAPSPAQWQQAAALALRAPDHRGLRPFRFVLIDDAQRERLADLFEQAAVRRGLEPDEVQRARARAYNGPGLLAVVVRIQDGVADVPPHEQWLSAGAGLMNLLNALHLMGFGAKVLSGQSVRDPDVRAAFCEGGEQLVAWVIAGTPTRAAHARASDDAASVLERWRDA